jgi:general secretion pathway protein E
MSANQGRDLRTAASGALAARLPQRYLEEHCVLPMSVEADGTLVAAIGAPLDPTVHDELVRLFGRPLRCVEMSAAEIRAAILSARQQPEHASAISDAEAGTDVAVEDVQAAFDDAPVVQVVNALLLDALRTGASDVHVECTADGLRVRFRLDGVLQDVSRLALQYRAPVISRIKIMAGLNIAERRLPQDGRARIRLGEREVDLRIATLPALHGESVVLRVLDHASAARDLADLGMPASIEGQFRDLVRLPGGIILVTGPTGSGKTTTLYGALMHVNGPGVKIVTVEDPVEYRIDGVTQIPANRKAGLSFPAALRSILRHDPDIVMVGEMRDRETAAIAVQAALTGHLVFSTLHTVDAASGIARLLNMGVEPYLVAATVQGILAQRLVRVLCGVCRGSGCDECALTGYRGRTGIFELLVVSEQIRQLIADQAPLAEIRAMAAGQGMITLREDGLQRVAAGITTVDEVLRVTGAGGDP